MGHSTRGWHPGEVAGWDVVYNWTPVATTMYTVKGFVGAEKAFVKVWPVGDPEPDWQAVTDVSTATSSSYPFNGIFLDGGVGGALLDNIVIYGDVWSIWGRIACDAVIQRPPSFTADAFIKAKGFSADAIIRKTTIFAGGPMLSAPFFVGSHAYSSWPAISSHVTPVPIGTQAGDFLLHFIVLGRDNQDGTIPTVVPTGNPAPWHLIDRFDFPGDTYQSSYLAYWGIETGSGLLTAQWNITPARSFNSVIGGWRGPVGLLGYTTETRFSETPVSDIEAPAIDMHTTFAELVRAFQSGMFGGTGSFTIPGGASLVDTYHDFYVQQMVDQIFAAGPGTLGPVTSTISDPDSGAPRRFGWSVLIGGGNGLTADAVIRAYQFTANATIASIPPIHLFNASAQIERGFKANAWFSPAKKLTANATIRRAGTTAFTADAAIVSTAPPPHFPADAMILRPRTGSFTARAYLYFFATRSSSFSSDAWVIGTVANFTADAQIAVPATHSASLSADASISKSYRQKTFSANAVTKATPFTIFTGSAVIGPPPAAIAIKDFIADAVDWYPSLGAVPISASQFVHDFTVEPGEPSPYIGQEGPPYVPHRSGWVKFIVPVGQAIQAQFDTHGSNYDTVLTAFQGDTYPDVMIAGNDDSTDNTSELILTLSAGTYWFDITPYFATGGNTAIFTITQLTLRSFTADAALAGRFSADAVIFKSYPAFTANAITRSTGWGFLTMAAVIARGVLHMDAVIKAPTGGFFEPIAIIRRPGLGSFSASARIGGGFTANAFIAGYFRADAYISSDQGVKYFPPGGGPPIDKGTGDPYLEPAHKVRVQILIDGVDWTQYAIIANCEFTQSANNSPGTFVLPLDGVHPFDGGNEILVLIDGFRQFGGIVASVAQTFAFADYPHGITVLQGNDFNILLDHAWMYNVPKTTHGADEAGEYFQIPDMPKGSIDKAVIAKAESYVDAMWRKMLDFDSYVDAVASPVPETPFVFSSGQTLRTFFQYITQTTNAIVWVNPYYQIEYHSRARTTAPFAIVEGTGGGVSCRDLVLTTSIDGMVNEALVSGVLATTVTGTIVTSRHINQALIDQYGRWQFYEARSDLHLANHVSQRAGSILSRKGLLLKRATLTIFEKGFQAGQVATVQSAEYDEAFNLVIRTQQLTFGAGQGGDNGVYYAIPIFRLELGNDPEDPPDLYDMIPFDKPTFTAGGFDFPPFRIKMPHLNLWTAPDTPYGMADPCAPGWYPGAVTVFRDDFERSVVPAQWGNGGCGNWVSSAGNSRHYAFLGSPPPWCVVIGLTTGANIQSVLFPPSAKPQDDSSWAVGVSPGGALAITTQSQSGVQTTVHSPDLGILGPVFVRIQRTQTYLRARCWSQTAPEPDTWTTAVDVYNDPSFPGGGLNFGSWIDVGPNPPTGIAVSGAPGWGYAWYEADDPVNDFPTEYYYNPDPVGIWGAELLPGWHATTAGVPG